MSSCTARHDITHRELQLFEEVDREYPGKGSVVAGEIAALDGSKCQARSRDGVAQAGTSSGVRMCVDLGIGSGGGVRSDLLGEWPLFFFPPTMSAPPEPQMIALGAQLARRLEARQFPRLPGGCPSGTSRGRWRESYYVHEVPLVGFGSIIEYVSMFLARSAHMGAQLSLGPASSRVWTSDWACGRERSLACYFNLTGCCAVPTMGGSPVRLPRRRNPLNLGMPGYNRYGAAWVSGQATA